MWSLALTDWQIGHGADLDATSRDEGPATVIGRLERRIAQLEDRAAHRGCRPQAGPKSPGSRWPPPTGWSTWWRAAPIAGPRCPAAGPIDPSEVIDLPRVPASHRARLHRPGLSPLPAQLPPPGELDGAAHDDRHPRPFQWYLASVAPQRSRSHPSMAQQARRGVRLSVVHADETGWREAAATFSTPTDRYFLRRGRGMSPRTHETTTAPSWPWAGRSRALRRSLRPSAQALFGRGRRHGASSVCGRTGGAVGQQRRRAQPARRQPVPRGTAEDGSCANPLAALLLSPQL